MFSSWFKNANNIPLKKEPVTQKEETVLPEEILNDGVLVGGLPDGNIDFYSPTWRYIEEYCKQELDRLRKLNDNIRKSDIETASLRGEIKCIKKIMSLSSKSKQEIEE